MDLEIKTVGDALNVHCECTQLASVLTLMAAEFPNLVPATKKSLSRAAELLEFLGEEVLMNLKVVQ